MSERVCSLCNKPKSDKDFFFRDKSKNKLHSQCKTCYTEKRKVNYKRHYHKYGDQYRQRAIVRKRIVKASLRVKMLEYLSNKSCIICGLSDVRVLDFDHINPKTKDFSIAKGLSDLYAWDKILVEIDKCRILCANCHRIVTSEQQAWYKRLPIESSRQS